MSIFDRLRDLFAPRASPTMAPPPAKPYVPPPPKPKHESPISRRVIERSGADIVALEGPVEADISIDLSNCRNLKSLPEGVTTGTLTLSGCTAIETLPGGLDVAFLDLDGCTALRALPGDLRLRGGRLNLRGCAQLTALPAGLGEVAQLDLSGCRRIEQLPEDLVVTSWIDVGDSGITALPARYDHVGLRWNGDPVSRQVAFER